MKTVSYPGIGEGYGKPPPAVLVGRLTKGLRRGG